MNKKISRFISIFIVLILCVSLFGCGNSNSVKNVAQKVDANIVKTPAQQLAENLVDYTDENGCFTAKIPQGWEVSTAGYDMQYWIRIYDPENPNLQVFSLLKTECLLKNDSSKQFYQQYRNYTLYTMFADMIVADEVQDFYTQFPDFCTFMTNYEPTYNGFVYPQISNFEVLEKYDYNSLMHEVAMEDTALHATFANDAGEQGEGIFTGTLCNGYEVGGIGCNMMYNINAITSSYGEFNEYSDLLSTVLSSITYTDTFTNTVMTDLQIKADGASQLSQTLSETSDIIMSGWENRQTSYDIISEKQSDATLGYERVYDIETGDIYRAYNGFTDSSEVLEYYQPITDDMYSEPIVGYIEK